MNITTVGIDLAKNIFQLHGVNEVGETVLTKKLSRKKLPEFIAQLQLRQLQGVGPLIATAVIASRGATTELL